MSASTRTYTRWQRVARLLFAARNTVLGQGDGVIVKWDGARDNGKIYTVVLEGEADSGARFRQETQDLEKALTSVFPCDTDGLDYTVMQLAELLPVIDDAARHGLVVVLRMTRISGVLNANVFMTDPLSRALIFQEDHEDMLIVLGRLVQAVKSTAGVPFRA